MTRHDEVFAMFASANPVSTLDRDAAAIPAMEDVLRTPDPPSSRQHVVPARATVGRRWMVAVAAFVLVIAAVGLSVALLRSDEVPPVATTSTTEDPSARVAADAAAAAREFLAAVAAGDIDAAMALSTPEASGISDRRAHEFNAAFAAAGMPAVVGDCATEQVTGSSALVRCAVTLGDVVAAELGQDEVVYPFRYQDGLLAWQEFDGDDFGEVNRAYADYLRASLPDEYAVVCSPGAYEPGTVVQANLLALTEECGVLAASIADDVVTWIRAGRPLE
jgi:hypothetical protein